MIIPYVLTKKTFYNTWKITCWCKQTSLPDTKHQLFQLQPIPVSLNLKARRSVDILVRSRLILKCHFGCKIILEAVTLYRNEIAASTVCCPIEFGESKWPEEHPVYHGGRHETGSRTIPWKLGMVRVALGYCHAQPTKTCGQGDNIPKRLLPICNLRSKVSWN